MLADFLKGIFRPVRLAILKAAIRIVERAGLAVVQVKTTDDAVYLISRRGTYVRYEKVKKP